MKQQYLPEKLSGRRYYVPIRGLESQMAARLDETRRRAAEAAAEGPAAGRGDEEEVQES